ncbi:MAG: 2-oxo acid dehydrogenase subunit E2 [Firmicutes bacterium]|nr:2-oxo acid dehydrogenase subunit E2 [Bacillota bacterium]
MAVPILMPKLGLTMDEGIVIRWLKTVGEPVQKGEPLLEVETDKSAVEVESSASGVLLQIVAGEGAKVPVGATIAYLAEEGEEAAAPGREKIPAGESAPAGENTPVRGSAPAGGSKPAVGRVKASPLARKLAGQAGLNLAGVVGSGPGHRIVKKDVLRLLEDRRTVVSQLAAPPTPRAAFEAIAGSTAVAPGTQKPVSIAPPSMGHGEGSYREPVTRMRKAIADRMLYSTSRIPQFFVSLEVELSRALSQIEALTPEVQNGYGAKLSVTDLLILATVRCLQKHREMNAYYLAGESLQDTFIEYHDFVNIGVAVALPHGLLVPVIPHVEQKGLGEIAIVRAEAVRKAREGRLGMDELQGGTFTISNMGGMGIDHFQAIINPPEAGILAVGRARKKPVVVGDAIAIRPVLELKLTADHRMIDGATAAAFLKDLATLLESGRLDVTYGGVGDGDVAEG